MVYLVYLQIVKEELCPRLQKMLNSGLCRRPYWMDRI